MIGFEIPSASKTPFKIAICIATKGRPGVLLETLRELRQQTRAPDRTLVCYSSPEDVEGAETIPSVELLRGPTGSTFQRNALLDAASECDAVLFLDDDFLPAPRYVEATISAFSVADGIVITTGRVIADGVKGPGINLKAARDLMAHDNWVGQWPGITPAWSGYGCNMAVRLSAAREHGIRFDERLPLYAWYEDIDFTRRLGLHGQVVRVSGASGVHLGVKSGRTSGRRLGYSQVVNPVYLSLKGSYPWDHAMRSIGRHLLANLLRSFWPEPHVDRRGRVVGNGLALLDLLRGRVRPERILEL